MSDNRHNIPITRPCFDSREEEAARRPISTGWVTQGPEVAKFEEEFALYVGAKHACAVSSCTTALHLALIASGVARDDEVITVSHSFIASANCIRYVGAVPVFVDIDPATFNIDPALIERAITSRTRAILCVHQMGMPCDLATILRIARRHSLLVIEDAACAIGSEIRWSGSWEKIGKPHGDIACFSFHPRKVISTGDGGMITTSNSDWDKRCRALRQHAMTVPDTVRHGAKQVIFETYSELGYNYRMTDIQAAIGREQLKRLPEIVERRRQLSLRYTQVFGNVQGLTPPAEEEWARSNWQSYCVRLPQGSKQVVVMQHLLDRGIATRRGIMSIHREPAYAVEEWSCGTGNEPCGCRQGVCERLGESEKATDSCVLLPLFPQLTEAEQDYVMDELTESLRVFSEPESRSKRGS